MATQADFDQKGAAEGCECLAKDGEDACDAKYGGMFTEGTGGPCATGDAGETTEGGDDMMDESGAAQLLAGTMALAAALLI